MIITLEGFVLPTRYIIKELTILYESGAFQHFHFNAPTDFIPTEKEMQTIKYTTKYLNQLNLHDESILPYSTLDVILKTVATRTIYVAGNAARKFLTAKLPTTCVIDISKKYGFKYAAALPRMSCFKVHTSRYCSLSKGMYIRNFLNSNVNIYV
tara:strand:- start:153 stop:614 length:462 start_codon:yes stop_codon:yes gene_type:complete